MKPYALVTVAVAVALAAAFGPPPTIVRPYWPVAVRALATTTHTHVEVRGTVTLVRREDDGDLHIRLSDSTGLFIVAECIPALPCRAPALGAIVTVRGISRRDPEHGWSEVHPVEWESP